MKTSDLHPNDYKYIVEKGDPGFNPDRNKWVVDSVIADTNAKIKKAKEAWKEPFRERAEAVAAYLTSPTGAASSNSVEKYFGKKTLAYLRGEEIVNSIKANISSNLWQRTANTRPFKAKAKKG